MARDNKTEQATPRRRQKAREKGQVVRSRELVASLATMSALLLLTQLGSFPGDWRAPLRGVACVLGLTWLVAALAALAQGGLVFAPASLAPAWSRLSPASRMEQLFSLTSISRLLKSLLPVAAVVYLFVAVLARDWGVLPALAGRSSGALARFLLTALFEFAWKAALVLVLWSGVDYLLERRKFESDLRMSRQEIVDEYKETEGNPTVKARIRRLQRQVRRRRMLKDVERAAVVITNPTAFAIALEFSPLMAAPVVVV